MLSEETPLVRRIYRRLNVDEGAPVNSTDQIKAVLHCSDLLINLEAALELMQSIESKVVPSANPCPSREDWERLKELLRT